MRAKFSNNKLNDDNSPQSGQSPVTVLLSIIGWPWILSCHVFSLTSRLANTDRMKPRSRFKLTLEDESRLETVGSFSASPKKWLAIAGCVSLVIMILGATIAFLTPLRTLLPGYMNHSERIANQTQLMRLDSLQNVYEQNKAFIDNIIKVMNPAASGKRDTVTSSLTTPMTPDSLLPTSPEEIRFVSNMKERDKYNISVMAQLAAESLMFSPPSQDGIFTLGSSGKTRGEIVMAKRSPVSAVADGTVIAVVQSLRDGGMSVTIQHPKGFLSRISRLGTVLVEPGDQVSGGQIIALPNRGNARKAERIYVELWRNGDQLVPSEYLDNKPDPDLPKPIIDVNVGRGRL